MARHGENIRKRRDGRWEARYQEYTVNGKKTYRSVYGCTYEEAKSKRASVMMLQENLTKQKHILCQDILFGTVAQDWLALMKSDKKLSTYEKYCFVYYGYLKTDLENLTLNQITENTISENKFSDKSSSLQKSIYCVLNQILKYASKQYSISLPEIKKPVSKTHKKHVEVFTKLEQSKLFSAVYHEMDRYKLAVLLCLFTGLRLGEICALKWSDIDLKNKTLFVKRTVQRLYIKGGTTKTSLIETEPKSARSKREIPLQNTIIELLIRFQNNKEYIFGGDKPMDPRTMQYHYKKILEEADVSYKNFHTLRHTYATNCIEGGTDVKSLSEMLGHSNIQITMNYYVHPSMDTKRRYADNLYAFYQTIHGQIYGKAS